MDIHEFELDDDVKEAEADELLDTLNEFMQKHEENVEEYRRLETDFSEAEDQLEDKQGTVDTLKTHFAGTVAEASPLFSEAEVAERYDAEELMEKAGAVDSDSEEEDESQFDDKPQKSRTEGGESGPDNVSTFADKAKEDYEDLMGGTVE